MPSSPAAPGFPSLDAPLRIALAVVAIGVPALIAFNVAPSATFLNQAAAYTGWGGFLLVLGAALGRQARPASAGALAVLAALAIIVVCALSASFWAAAPWPLTISSSGTVLSAMLAVAVGASLQRAGLGEGAFRAFCIGLVVAGVASSAIGLIQVFAPNLADGEWIAQTETPGRASGNLRQPNHLSSLLLWSVVAVLWLGQAKVIYREVAAMLALVFIYVVMLSASRTGALGMLTLAGWGLLDRRLSRGTRLLLILSPVLYGVAGWATSAWAASSDQLVIGSSRIGGSGDISNSRFAIWSNALSLIASHPWLGVGFGEFNFAWTLTPFPDRPLEFFDHTHNLVLNFLVELGVPLGLVVLGLLLFGLWRALRNAVETGRDEPERPSVHRAAFVIVFMVAVHSMLEYPLWYSYFLLPTAFAFGLCLERTDPALAQRSGAARTGNVTRPFVLGAMLLVLGGTLSLYDYMRVVVIFVPPARAEPLEKRIADGRHSVLFGHHADYAAATVAARPGEVMKAFERAPHYLLDARLMMAWATALEESGESEKARFVAARLKEFRNPHAADFFKPCEPVDAAEPTAAASPLPFQCRAPTQRLGFEDFK
jgi:O-antigen ligase